MFYVLQNLGYDGIYLNSYKTLEEAQKRFNEHKKKDQESVKKYFNLVNPNDVSFEPAIIIEGKVIEKYEWDLD